MFSYVKKLIEDHTATEETILLLKVSEIHCWLREAIRNVLVPGNGLLFFAFCQRLHATRGRWPCRADQSYEKKKISREDFITIC